MTCYSPLHVQLLAGLLVACSTMATASAQSLGSSFDMQTDAARVARMFHRFNNDPNHTLKLTAEGVDFEVGPGKAGGNVGYDIDAHIVGDFQLEVKYAILTAPDKVTEGYGLMLGLRAKISDKVGDGAMNRGIYGPEGNAYHIGRAVPLGGGTRYAGKSVPTQSRNGRMGLRRVGDTLYYLAAETPDGEFVLLAEYPYPGDKPVSKVTLYADSGGSKALFEGRLYDLKLMTGAAIPVDLPKNKAEGKELQKLPTAQEIADANKPKPTTSKADGEPTSTDADGDETAAAAPIRGLWWLVGICVIVVLSGGIFIGQYWQRKPSPPFSPPRKP